MLVLAGVLALSLVIMILVVLGAELVAVYATCRATVLGPSYRSAGIVLLG